ncbi:hypothetical protein CUR178_05838 [Leishmania enriettii]|uniref:Uncharacterized protein n=1 Tax=Leishmania enriettii TaxID=5663 RepID=A0A836HQ77_LEIEN|nr:hypothetical protein CUR178_05838 [Leishmania enriettii]
MQMPRQPLPPLHANGSWMSHGTPSVALCSAGGGESSHPTSTMAGITDGGTRAWKQPADIRHGHHRHAHDKLQPASSSPPSLPTADVQPARDEPWTHAVKAHLPVLGGTASRTDAALTSYEENVAGVGGTPNVLVPQSSIASPASATSATPSPPSARHTEIPDASPLPSVAAASCVSQAAAGVAETHLPPSDKLNAPLRDSSMARRRPQVKAQQKGVEAAAPSHASAPTSPYGPDAVAAALLNARPKEKGTSGQHPLYSYRPALPSTNLVSSPSPMPAALSVGAAKVLPNGLRSPSAITDVGAAPLDYSGRSSVEMGLANNVSPTRHRHHQQQKHFAAQPEQRAGNVSRSHVGGSTQTNAPFHALQFMALAGTNPIASPPLSSRSEAPHCQHHPHHCLDPRLDGNFVRAREKGKAGGAVPGGCRPARTTKAFAGGRLTISSPTASDCELQLLTVCPFALVGCCAEGIHRSADLHSGSTLHHHLMAVTKYVQRMRRRQRELEQLVHGLLLQLNTQAGRGRGVSEEVKRASQRHTAGRSLLISSQESLLGNRAGPTLALAGDSKALPRDVSICEPLATDYDMNSEDVDGAGRNTSRGYAGGSSHGSRGGPTHGTRRQRSASQSVRGGDGDRDGAGMFARQLRMRTSAGQQMLDVINAPSSTSVSPAPTQLGPRAVKSAARATTTHKMTAVGVHGRGEMMRCAASPQKRQQEQRRGRTNREGALSSTPLPNRLHSDALENVLCVSADGQVEGNDGTAKKCAMATSSVWRPLDADGSAESGGPPTRLGRPAASPLLYRGAYAPQQPGAGGSTEVSGMSNVPPYQIPNESVSPISSASLDLDDHEDDTDAGAMRQQLLNLTPTEIPVAVKADENYLTGGTDQSGAHVARKADLQASPGASPRSAPSLVSVTYRPSELARAEGDDAEGTMRFTDGGALARTESAQDVKNRPPQTNSAPAPLLVEGLRVAAPLQRPTLVRKSDVVLLPPAKRSGADWNQVAPRPETPPSITFLARLPSAAATSSIFSNSDVKRSRRMSAPESDSTRVPLSRINPNASSSPLSLRTPPTGASTSGGSRVHCNGVHASCNGIFLAAPLRESAVKRSPVSKLHPAHAHSCRVDSDETRAHVGGVTGSVDNMLSVPGKSVGRRNGSQTRREAALRRPQRATRVLSLQEAAGQVAATHLLGLHPRQET